MSEKSSWLDEVKEDAIYNYKKHLREQQEAQERKEAKEERAAARAEARKSASTAKPEDKKGK